MWVLSDAAVVYAATSGTRESNVAEFQKLFFNESGGFQTDYFKASSLDLFTLQMCGLYVNDRTKPVSLVRSRTGGAIDTSWDQCTFLMIYVGLLWVSLNCIVKRGCMLTWIYIMIMRETLSQEWKLRKRIKYITIFHLKSKMKRRRRRRRRWRWRRRRRRRRRRRWRWRWWWWWWW